MQYADWLHMKDDVSYVLSLVKDMRTIYPALPHDLNFRLDTIKHNLQSMKISLEENYAWESRPD